ncbi:uncharacterized protein SPPG_01365 [Spizellomyces punctatus DAOM BR117]|uniref:Uncharacterized protein n=1 Tax=Spizellomyces punctatus (strain DAOM BR117) TaxID=645134 RepID=A0A0L0HSQ8_SPIPD|nr:uncharacterized protein SPPG_01365 [Spizellomyces punctatus DAOM BR117]KND03914.1 hypothetical protein SPPG_01365 [Spizellomyces punctatus DAOM BR117]|eukprot:XP_016611953.1 hypothetical protein SPPG_01365 [Spizellomyces punctatus DAOM BR117]
MVSDAVANLASLLPSAAVLTLYHVYLVRCVKRTPGRTVYGLTSSARRVWVAAIMYRKNEILAVQSLRNWVMASSFLATTAVLIITTSMALLGSLAVNWTPTTLASPVSYTLGFVLDSWFGYRFAAVLAAMMLAFFCFMQSVRFFNHAALVCNVNITPDELSTFLEPANIAKKEKEEDMTLETYNYLRSNPTHVAAILNRGCFYYTVGMRCYYVSFPLLAWFWGPIPLAVCTGLLVIVLRLIDFHVAEFSGDQESEREGARWKRYFGLRGVKDAKGRRQENRSEDSVAEMVMRTTHSPEELC